MKKITLYHLLSVFVILLYVAILLAQHFTKLLPIDLAKFWCPLLLFMEGVLMLVKWVLFRSRTSFWFGMVLLLWGISLFLVPIVGWRYLTMIPLCLFSVAITGFIMGVLFHDSLQWGIGITMLFIAIPFLFYVLEMIQLWLAILIAIIIFTVCMFISRYIPERKGA